MIIKFTGKVIHGLKLGRKIGFRTANIVPPKDLVESGTYKINGVIGKKILAGVGTYMEKKGVFEAHFFDFDRNIYGKEVEIIVLKKIRDNEKFANFDALKKQIQLDAKVAKRDRLIGLTFGTFDVVHKGHRYYLFEARKYCDYLVTIIARDANVLKMKGALPRHLERERKVHIENFHVADKVVLGDKKNPLKWIDIFKPFVICLGYDQKGFSDKLLDSNLEKVFTAQIVRISPFKVEVYKSSLIKTKKLVK